jgi:hypothetical protein
LGFIAADGYVHNPHHLVEVSLAIKDVIHLAKLREALQATNPIQEYESGGHRHSGGHRYVRLVVRSTHILVALRRWGVVQAKTFTLPWPHSLSGRLLQHFLRGYIDGDGGFHLIRTAYPRPEPRFEVTSNTAFIQECQRYLMAQCDLRQTKLGVRNSQPLISTIQYGGRWQVRRIFEFVYRGASIWMPRKHDLVEPWFSP